MSQPILSAKAVRKTFGKFVALDNVTFDLQPKERRALIGPNGAGKSTFIGCVAGQLPGAEGQIIFKGEDVTKLQPSALAKRGISRTFQISRTFLHLTVFENMMSAFIMARGLWPSLNTRVFSGLEDEVHAMLKNVGMNTRANEAVVDISLGDRKRLEFGMALAADPELLLLDEPTAGMSIKERHHLMDMVVELVESTGKTLLFVEHDIDVVFRVAKIVTVMVRGSVFVEGTPKEIAANEEVQKVYLGEGDH